MFVWVNPQYPIAPKYLHQQNNTSLIDALSHKAHLGPTTKLVTPCRHTSPLTIILLESHALTNLNNCNHESESLIATRVTLDKEGGTSISAAPRLEVFVVCTLSDARPATAKTLVRD